MNFDETHTGCPVNFCVYTGQLQSVLYIKGSQPFLELGLRSPFLWTSRSQGYI
jgi:hypothetical protein